ncbi:MAG: hypothetical protein WDZ30_01345 [Cellvibrionaceae bacterium]
MTERLRQHYLRALGIETYVPRQLLPGAAASSFSTEEIEGDDLAPESTEPMLIVPLELDDEPDKSATSSGIRFPDNLFEEKKKFRQDRQFTPPASVASEHRFALSVWRIAENVLVLDSRKLKLALPVEQLLLNISHALGFKLATLPRAEVVRWPLSDRSSMPVDSEHSIAGARAMVQAYLGAQYEKQPFGALLLMGPEAVQHGLAAQDTTGDDWKPAAMAALLGKLFTLRFGASAPEADNAAVQAIALPSLAAMLQDPSLKAETWRAIKYLRVSP